jgi:hypothetical protein
MSLDVVVVQGNLKPDGTLELDEKPALGPGRVQVTLRSLAADSPSERNLSDVLKEIHAAQRASGFVARPRDAIDAEIQQMRAEWDEPRKETARSQE